jgi:hypothetical protein
VARYFWLVKDSFILARHATSSLLLSFVMAVPSNVKVAQTAFSIYLLIVGVLIEFFPALVHTLVLLVPGCQDVPTPEGDMFAGICAMFYQYLGIMYLCMLDNEEFVAWSVTGRLVFVNGLLLMLVAHGNIWGYLVVVMQSLRSGQEQPLHPPTPTSKTARPNRRVCE